MYYLDNAQVILNFVTAQSVIVPVKYFLFHFLTIFVTVNFSVLKSDNCQLNESTLVHEFFKFIRYVPVWKVLEFPVFSHVLPCVQESSSYWTILIDSDTDVILNSCWIDEFNFIEQRFSIFTVPLSNDIENFVPKIIQVNYIVYPLLINLQEPSIAYLVFNINLGTAIVIPVYSSCFSQ